MMPEVHLPVQMLGQSGCSINFPGAKVYTDPYLSDSVRDLDAQDLERQLPIPVSPEEIRDADWVLITHDHIDHCDPHTIPKLAKASPKARFIAPEPVLNRLRSWGVESSQISLADENWKELTSEIRLRCVPAAHPEIERDSSGRLTCVGYLIEYAGKRIYLAGDTGFSQDMLPPLLRDGEIHTAFLPVNENNFFLNRRGIIGNMSVREAFCFAEEIGAKQVVPVHWDMFAVNSVSPEEIRLVHRSMNPDFSLLLNPKSINLADKKISIVIRTLNESRHLEALLQSIAEQRLDGLSHEVIIVDSGSTDRTLEIAERNGCRIVHIERAVFSYGRSLNMGCD
ncbi:MAG: MBL fold metallo-hydrolase, partial [Candidatus Omnitrophica bacterium]|nr:MBL fold metallo-hydrolase [Candidatus Omnitrophota bacterium]